MQIISIESDPESDPIDFENGKLKRLLAETMLDNAALKDIVGRKW